MTLLIGHTTKPDPDNQNADRAEWALIAVMAFQDTTSSEDDAAIGDLVCDLMHLCDRTGLCFETALANARYHYGEETRDEEAA